MMSPSCGVGQTLKVGKLRGDLIAETDMMKSSKLQQRRRVGVKLGPKLCACCWSEQLFKHLHLAEHAVRMRKCAAKKKKRLPTLTHTHIL